MSGQWIQLKSLGRLPQCRCWAGQALGASGFFSRGVSSLGPRLLFSFPLCPCRNWWDTVPCWKSQTCLPGRLDIKGRGEPPRGTWASRCCLDSGTAARLLRQSSLAIKTAERRVVSGPCGPPTPAPGAVAIQRLTHPVLLFSHGPNLEHLTWLTVDLSRGPEHLYHFRCNGRGGAVLGVLFLNVRKGSNVQPECVLWPV